MVTPVTARRTSLPTARQWKQKWSKSMASSAISSIRQPTTSLFTAEYQPRARP